MNATEMSTVVRRVVKMATGNDAARVYAQGTLQITAHRSGTAIVVEAERASQAAALEGLFSRLRGFVEVLSAQREIAGALQATSDFILDLTGFDRVLVYRFDDEWNGHVIAEAGNGNLPSYLDLRFPASDIPAQARALYASNRVRIIADANYQPIPIEPAFNPDTAAPLDLSFAQLRSVSPVHLEYMRNMKTAASMSVSVMVDGRLWGLVSCHSAQPHNVPVTIRDACDFIVQSLAMRIAAQIHGEDAASRVELAKISARLLASMTSSADWLEGLVSMPAHSATLLLTRTRFACNPELWCMFVRYARCPLRCPRVSTRRTRFAPAAPA